MKKYLSLFKETWKEFNEDKAPRLGAALAYYTVFSIAPILLIAVAIAGLVFGQEAATHQIQHQLDNVMGSATAKGVEEMIKNAAKPKTGTLATIIGIITLIFGAAGVFGQLKDALNTIWNVEAKPAGGIIGMIRQRFLSLAMVMGVGFLLLVSLVFDAVLAAMGDWISARFPGGETLLHIVGLIVSFALITVLFAMIFRFLPDTRVEWRDVWFGAAFTSLLFALGKFALGLYLGKGSVGSAYGAAGSLVIILVWVYWSAQILFFGAEFTQVYARTHGSRIGDDSKEKAKATAERVEDRPKEKATASHPAFGHPLPAQRGEGQRAGGGAIKLAIGGIAGLLIGAIAGIVSAFVLLFKSAKKLIP